MHVSELARRLGMSRPLLYMHLDRLEKADLVTGHLELSDDGKAMKYLELVPFELRVTAETVVNALAEDADAATALLPDLSDKHTKIELALKVRPVIAGRTFSAIDFGLQPGRRA